jgi:hypothetical protein
VAVPHEEELFFGLASGLPAPRLWTACSYVIFNSYVCLEPTKPCGFTVNPSFQIVGGYQVETPGSKGPAEARGGGAAAAAPSTRLECLERAAECIRKAGEATDPLVRQQFMDLARQWGDLADKAKRYGW